MPALPQNILRLNGGKTIMGVPQVILVFIYAIDLGIDLAKDGKPKEGNENFSISLLGTVITMSLLWWGGFFK